MHRVIRGIVAGAVLAAVTSVAASAQTPAILDLKGTWTGTTQTIVDGATPHHPGHAETSPAGKYALRQQNLTFKVEGQDGRRFWGATASDHAPDVRLIGSLSPDGKWIYIVGNNALGDGSVVDNDRFNLCVRLVPGASAMVACADFKRQK